MNTYTIQQSAFAHFLTASVRSAPLWLLVRLFLGYEFLIAGWNKFTNPIWFGGDAGAALQGFVNGALKKTAEFCANPAACHPDVYGWYASFLQSAVLPNLVTWSNAVVIGEIAIGLGLIVGLFTRTAAFFAFFMSFNFLLAGTVSENPMLIMLALGIMLAHRVAGHYGLDRYALPFIRRTLRLRSALT